MPGQATITINENQWNVWVASTYSELTTGLSEVASLAAGTGMLFILPAKQAVSVDTRDMSFPIDIIFISENTVIDVASNIQPGYLVTEETPCDMFLEVNAGEAAGVEVGDMVTTATIQQPGFDWSQITSFAVPLAALGFVCAMAGGVMKLAGGSASSPKQLPPSKGSSEITPKEWEFAEFMWQSTKELMEEGDISGTLIWGILQHHYPSNKEKQTRLLGFMNDFLTEQKKRHPKGVPSDVLWELARKWDVERAVVTETLRAFPGVQGWASSSSSGTRELQPKHPAEKVTVTCPLCEKVIEIPEYDKVTKSEALREHIKAEHSHQSMWLTPDERKNLEEKYGAVAVRWAEEATRPGDIKAAERAAEYYYKKIKEAFGLGHLSAELSEEQIRKLREALGLPADVAEILKIHRETGYVP